MERVVLGDGDDLEFELLQFMQRRLRAVRQLGGLSDADRDMLNAIEEEPATLLNNLIERLRSDHLTYTKTALYYVEQAELELK